MCDFTSVHLDRIAPKVLGMFYFLTLARIWYNSSVTYRGRSRVGPETGVLDALLHSLRLGIAVSCSVPALYDTSGLVLFHSPAGNWHGRRLRSLLKNS